MDGMENSHLPWRLKKIRTNMDRTGTQSWVWFHKFHTNTLENDEMNNLQKIKLGQFDQPIVLWRSLLLQTGTTEFRHGRKHGMWRETTNFGVPWFGRQLSVMQPWNLKVKILGQSLREQPNKPKLPWYFEWRNSQNETSKTKRNLILMIAFPFKGCFLVDVIYIIWYIDVSFWKCKDDISSILFLQKLHLSNLPQSARLMGWTHVFA